MHKPPFTRLIRFLANDGRILYGDVQAGTDIEQLAGKRVKLLRGSPRTELTETKEEATVEKVRFPCFLPFSLLPKQPRAASELGSLFGPSPPSARACLIFHRPHEYTMVEAN